MCLKLNLDKTFCTKLFFRDLVHQTVFHNQNTELCIFNSQYDKQIHLKKETSFIRLFYFSTLDMHCLWNYLNNDCEDSAQMMSLACYFLSMFHIGFNVYHCMQIYHVLFYL